MPIYVYRCPEGCIEERFVPLAQHGWPLPCTVHPDYILEQVITAPLLVKAQQECRYTSPIDGAPVTTWAARRNDLDKHNCRPYDEGMKADYLRRQEESQRQLDAAIDTHVEAAIERMPTKERGKLYSELTEQGMTATVERT